MLALAIPAAYALAIKPIRKWRDVLFFFISTKFLPVVASILPLWILRPGARPAQHPARARSSSTPAINLPLAVWMLRSFFKEIPRELIEAAEIDGAGLRGQLATVILPIAAPGIAATALLCVIFAWNEYFYAVQLNPASGSTMPIWVTTNISTRGDFLAKLSAASVLACLPVVIAGWLAQKRMIRGPGDGRDQVRRGTDRDGLTCTVRTQATRLYPGTDDAGRRRRSTSTIARRRAARARRSVRIGQVDGAADARRPRAARRRRRSSSATAT